MIQSLVSGYPGRIPSGVKGNNLGVNRLENQVFSIQDFPYAGIDFRGDPDMALPPGEQWDESGKILFNFSYFNFFIFPSSQN